MIKCSICSYQCDNCYVSNWPGLAETQWLGFRASQRPKSQLVAHWLGFGRKSSGAADSPQRDAWLVLRIQKGGWELRGLQRIHVVAKRSTVTQPFRELLEKDFAAFEAEMPCDDNPPKWESYLLLHPLWVLGNKSSYTEPSP